MNVSAKNILLIILSIIGTLVLSLIFGNKLNNLGNFSSSDVMIFVVVGIGAIIIVVYKRIGEIDKEINNVRKKTTQLDEKLKIHQLLINLECRVINLEMNKNDKRR